VGYSSRHGRRPSENASKASHSHVINDAEVQKFLAGCNLPKKTNDISLNGYKYIKCEPPSENPIKHVIAIDSGYNPVIIDKDFPSSEICFFQFGALIFSISDLDHLRTIFEFFCKGMENEDLIETLKWFIFEEYETPKDKWTLARCPYCETREIDLVRASITNNYTFPCSKCNKDIYLTDVFRLHEAVDNELGAGGILGYLTTVVEQVLIVHFVRLILKAKPALMRQVLFVRDGPLAFFGQTANMHKPMRQLVQFLVQKHDFYLGGLEKSGAFVEHADQIASLMTPGTALILNNDYIYRYIIPNTGDPSSAYGRTTYYGNKLIFKTTTSGMYVITLPTTKETGDPNEKDFHNLQSTLANVEKLRCDMYDNSLIPVALANKLVSLANHPSSKILQRFAIETVGH
jgi:hypothetical protein